MKNIKPKTYNPNPWFNERLSYFLILSGTHSGRGVCCGRPRGEQSDSLSLQVFIRSSRNLHVLWELFGNTTNICLLIPSSHPDGLRRVQKEGAPRKCKVDLIFLFSKDVDFHFTICQRELKLSLYEHWACGDKLRRCTGVDICAISKRYVEPHFDIKKKGKKKYALTIDKKRESVVLMMGFYGVVIIGCFDMTRTDWTMRRQRKGRSPRVSLII